MNEHWDMSYLGVMVDMAGCPNRCRHCWLGSHRNGNLSVNELRGIAGQFKSWRDESGRGIGELGFFSWWREPDYRDDYRELWTLEQELSSPGRAKRSELLSTWRLARDESYAKWAATLEPKVCQITFFGMEESTDWGMRRKGAFCDQLLATERCLEVGIAPRWQLFLTKRCTGELDAFLQLIYERELHKRCESIGQKFEFFIGGMSPEGNGYAIEHLRLEESDLPLIPQELVSLSRDRAAMLGRPEGALYRELIHDHAPPQMSANTCSVSINADYQVYPNIAEPAEWWCLGNLQTDGVDRIIKTYRDEATLGMSANRRVPISELVRRYGVPDGKRLYHRDDLICRFMHQWGEEHQEGKTL